MGHCLIFMWANGLGVVEVVCDDCNYREWFSFEDGPEGLADVQDYVSNEDHPNWNWVRPVPK